MTRQEAALLRTVERRLRDLQPALSRAFTVSIERLRTVLTDAEIRDLLAGRTTVERVLPDALLVAAFAPVQKGLRTAVERASMLAMTDLPVKPSIARGAILFDWLNPNVITAIRTLESRTLVYLKRDVREVVRAYVENGLRDGVAPASVGRQLRSALGLGRQHVQWLTNYETELRTLDRNALARELTDARYDHAVRKAIATGTPLTEEQITQRVALYRRSIVAHHADTVTYAAARDSYRLGQQLAWEGAVDNGFVDERDIEKEWVHFMPQPNPRAHHRAMHGQRVPLRSTFSNGDYVPGESDPWNCHCTAKYVVVRRARIAA